MIVFLTPSCYWILFQVSFVYFSRPIFALLLSITGAQYLTGSVFNGLSITGAQQRGVTRPSRRGLLVLTVAAAEGNAPLLAMHFDFIGD